MLEAQSIYLFAGQRSNGISKRTKFSESHSGKTHIHIFNNDVIFRGYRLNVLIIKIVIEKSVK